MLDIRCIVAIVERGKADKIIKKAKEAGATGASVFYGRGTGETEAKRFLNVNIEASKEMILILTPEENRKTITDAMIKEGKLKEPGTGIIFNLKINDLAGLNHRKNFE